MLKRSGLFLILISSILFGIMSFLVKISARTIPSHEILFFRSIFGLFVILFFYHLKLAEFKFVNKPLLVWRALFGGAAVMCFFFSLSKISLSISSFLNSTYPLFATIFAGIFIKEKLKKDALLALAISTFGIYILLNPASVNINVGHIFALFSGILAGLAVLCVRKLRETDSSWAVFLSFTLGSLIFSTPFLFYSFKLPDKNEFFVLLLMAIVSTIAQIISSYAYKFASAGEGSAVTLSIPVFSAILGFLFLGETLKTSQIFGATLVLGSGAYLIVKERFLKTLD